jgi:uncharacterized damage-inducible protein DinB
MPEQDRQFEQGSVVEQCIEKLDGARKATTDIYKRVIVLGNDATENVAGGASVKVQLLHQVKHSLLRIEAFSTGGFNSYKYDEANPEGYGKIKNLSAEALLEIYEDNSRTLKEKFSEPGLQEKTFKMPNGSDISGLSFLIDILAHEEYHVGQLSVMETFIGIERSEFLNKHWGLPLDQE